MKVRGTLFCVLLWCLFVVLWAGAEPEPAALRRNYGMRSPRTIQLKPCGDPSSQAEPRFRDIADIPLRQFQSNGAFDYANAAVALTYDQRPQYPFFVGHIHAAGLKPNFAYQLKLVGKPRDGRRGWHGNSDDISNARIGYAGRWWCDSEQKNVDDRHYQWLYSSPHGTRHSVYGYLFMGDVVTDQYGQADLTFTGSRSYHITWADRQAGSKDLLAGVYRVESSTPPYYGYGRLIPPRQIRLWYEYERHRSHLVRLPAGTYNCRFVLEEETFHNRLDDGTKEDGGYWMAVMSNEEFGAPDLINAVRWTVGS